jgi:hypothetical protein
LRRIEARRKKVNAFRLFRHRRQDRCLLRPNPTVYPPPTPPTPTAPPHGSATAVAARTRIPRRASAIVATRPIEGALIERF